MNCRLQLLYTAQFLISGVFNTPISSPNVFARGVQNIAGLVAVAAISILSFQAVQWFYATIDVSMFHAACGSGDTLSGFLTIYAICTALCTASFIRIARWLLICINGAIAKVSARQS